MVHFAVLLLESVFFIGLAGSLVVAVLAFVGDIHVFLDKEYHVEGSRLRRFAWFRRKQKLHFAHHRDVNCNFAVIDFFWDRVLGTYRGLA